MTINSHVFLPRNYQNYILTLFMTTHADCLSFSWLLIWLCSTCAQLISSTQPWMLLLSSSTAWLSQPSSSDAGLGARVSVGTVLNIMKPMRITTSDTIYSPENWGREDKVRLGWNMRHKIDLFLFNVDGLFIENKILKEV